MTCINCQLWSFLKMINFLWFVLGIFKYTIGGKCTLLALGMCLITGSCLCPDKSLVTNLSCNIKTLFMHIQHEHKDLHIHKQNTCSLHRTVFRINNNLYMHIIISNTETSLYITHAKAVLVKHMHNKKYINFMYSNILKTEQKGKLSITSKNCHMIITW